MEETQLVTITCASLATEIGRSEIDAYPGGVWLVKLAAGDMTVPAHVMDSTSEVFQRFGWIALEERSPAAARFRRATGDTDRRGDPRNLRQDVTLTLSNLAS